MSLVNMKSIGQVYNDFDVYNFVYDFYNFCQIAMIFHMCTPKR